MRIIFLGKNPKKPKAVSIKAVGLILFLFLFLNVTLVYFYIENKEEQLRKIYGKNPISPEIFLSETRLDYEKNLNIYLDKIGELYTRIVNIDKQTERLQYILKKQIVGKDKVPMINKEKEKENISGEPLKENDFTSSELNKEIESLMARIELREELYNTMESILLKESVLKDTLPSLKPVNIPYSSSSYGWRHDPIIGKRAFHQGLDFSAAHGEPFFATASGIVIASERGVNYGNYIKVKHGGGLETRYAHASKLLVKVGDIVSKGEVIGLVGNTGRSTGPHLHYEIRLNGNSLDPRKYLKK
jgi:murein DD-endopeptidase MepM/ murein hydrolase activator NlpD